MFWCAGVIGRRSELEIVKSYRRDGDVFARMTDLSVENEDTLTTPLLPEFSIFLAEILAPPL